MLRTILNTAIASVWIINGLVCKVLDMVPRHEQIVTEILGSSHSRALTVIIGVMEMAMAVWILSTIKQKLSTIVQITIVMAMNALEFFLVPDLLLWGKYNALFALLFIAVVYVNGFCLTKKQKGHEHEMV